MLKASVIIPNTNSPLIGKIIDALEHQTVERDQFDVLIIGEDRLGLIHPKQGIQYIKTEHGAYASDKRNIGIDIAQGEILAFIDDDCIPNSNWLKQLLIHYQTGYKIVGGSVTFGSASYLQLADNLSAFHDLLPYTSAGPRPYLATANLSIHRTVIEEAGKMPPHRNRAEDLEWTVRFRKLGYMLYFEPEAVVYHNPQRHTWDSLWHHWYDDAHDTLKVRLRYQRLLNTPRLAKFRSIYFWGAPLVAAWATTRTFKHPKTLFRYWHTWPLVYWTKIIWCWGAYNNFPTIEE